MPWFPTDPDDGVDHNETDEFGRKVVSHYDPEDDCYPEPGQVALPDWM